MKLLGWQSIRRGRVEFLRCPGCGKLWDLLFTTDNLYQCYRCNGKFPLEEFKPEKLLRRIAVCGGCGQDVELVPRNAGWLGYSCSNCQNYVALRFGRGLGQPSTVLNPKWLEIPTDRLLVISPSVLALECHSKRQFLALHAIQVTAKEEEGSFLSARFGENQALLLVKPDLSEFLGYLLWSITAHAVLNQLYVVPDERKKGYASLAVRYWVEQYADRVNDVFHVESPNRKTVGLLLKLGYGEKCRRV